jgi:hypothetical protein
MTKSFPRVAFGALLIAALAVPATADIMVGQVGDVRIFLGAHTVGTVQALTQDAVFDAQGNALGDLEPGFQTAWGNLEVRGTFGEEEEIEMFFDLLISSRPHPSTTYGHEGWLMIRGVPENLQAMRFLEPVFDRVNFKVGHFHIDYGDHLLRRSDNADVQHNPFVGNFVVDPEMVEVGAEISSKPGPFNWLVGLSSGTNTEDFREGRGTALHGKVWTQIPEDLRLALSYYTVDHSDNGPGTPPGSKTNLFAANRDGGRFGGVWGGGGAPGQILPKNGQDMDAWQADATWTPGPATVYLSYGNTKDSDIDGSVPGEPTEEWAYYAADFVWSFSDELYAGARISGADAASVEGNASDGTVQRLSVGAGYWFTRHLLGKLELVREDMNDFEQGVVLNGIQAWRDPSFSGAVAEVSFSF